MGSSCSAEPEIEIVLSHQIGICLYLRIVRHGLDRIVGVATNVPPVFAYPAIIGAVLFPVVNRSHNQVAFFVLKLQPPLCMHLVAFAVFRAVISGFAKRLNQVVISCLNITLQTRACYTSILVNQFIHTSLLLLVYVYIVAPILPSVNQNFNFNSSTARSNSSLVAIL